MTWLVNSILSRIMRLFSSRLDGKFTTLRVTFRTPTCNTKVDFIQAMRDSINEQFYIE